MKTSLVFAALLATTLAGCASQSSHPATSTAPLHPAGTDVGTSFPGVNQGTGPTTATASSDSR